MMSGFFFAYAFSVNLGLHKLDNKAYLLAMQNINKETLNPVFYICFFGALVLLVVSSILHFDVHSPKSNRILAACISYIFGVFIVTGLRNVPLNDQLAIFDVANASEKSMENIRYRFENSWVFWNSVRTLASFITLVCLIISVVFRDSTNN